MRFSKKSLLFTAIILAGCNTTTANDTNEQAASSSEQVQSSSSVRETNNVSYQGVVRPSGISIYMEGTHRLELDSDRFILLQSDSIDLNGYVGESVIVFGSVRPTVESDAMIMTVSDITLRSSSSSSVVSESSSSTSESSADIQSEVSSSSINATSSSESNKTDSVQSSESSPMAAIEYTAEFEARIATMAQEDVSAARWTQQYCTGHIGFCVPVHKNWWFQSFGATNSDLWHVEMNSQPLDKIHDGPIVVRLMQGSLADVGVADGDVVQKGNMAVGYRQWTDGRHFEVQADVRLQQSVQYITDNLKVYNAE